MTREALTTIWWALTFACAQGWRAATPQTQHCQLIWSTYRSSWLDGIKISLSCVLRRSSVTSRRSITRSSWLRNRGSGSTNESVWRLYWSLWMMARVMRLSLDIVRNPGKFNWICYCVGQRSRRYRWPKWLQNYIPHYERTCMGLEKFRWSCERH